MPLTWQLFSRQLKRTHNSHSQGKMKMTAWQILLLQLYKQTMLGSPLVDSTKLCAASLTRVSMFLQYRKPSLKTTSRAPVPEAPK
ncbi:hypothetical protein RRG08_058434 [Elysia crispata]|uniref:Uncharacterized protein n=1 Tax=Elysia crispata TaxID=231223 RepID=A0AAE1AAN8_9GAST|nr:hypothetical protein RRG08_058434 [Elysia crispata]